MNEAVLQLRKRHGAYKEEEDAMKLSFGPEFDLTRQTHDGMEPSVYALNLSEARLLINAALEQRRRGSGDEALPHGTEKEEEEEGFLSANETLRKTQEYLSVFARFKDEPTVSAVEHLLRSPENVDLHPFEIAQLGSLVCDDAGEAKALIPTLTGKKSDEELQVLLDQLRKFG